MNEAKTNGELIVEASTALTELVNRGNTDLLPALTKVNEFGSRHKDLKLLALALTIAGERDR